MPIAAFRRGHPDHGRGVAVRLAAASLLMLASPACAQIAPEAPPAAAEACKQDFLPLTGRIVDEADLLNPVEENHLGQSLAALEDRTKHQFVVVTVKSLQGKAIDEYSLCLANHWGIGRKDVDDGVMLLVAPNERKVRIDVGVGLETVLTDAESQTIMEGKIIPAFKDGQMARGIEDGATAIIREVS